MMEVGMKNVHTEREKMKENSFHYEKFWCPRSFFPTDFNCWHWYSACIKIVVYFKGGLRGICNQVLDAFDTNVKAQIFKDFEELGQLGVR